jgi:hypothetical protein
MSNKNLFYGNWQNFVKKQNLQEMEEQYRDLIDNVTEVAFANPEMLPFGSIFGNKLRIAVPLVQKNSGKLQTILDFIYNFGAINSQVYKPIQIEATTKQVKTKIAGRETTKEIADFVVTKSDRLENPKTGEFYDKKTQTNVPTILKKAIQDFKRMVVEKQKELNEVPPDAPAWQRQMRVDGVEFANKRIVVANQMIEWWQKNQAKIVEDVELVKFVASMGNTSFINGSWENFASESDAEMGKVDTRYSIVYSRAPIDVLRMSDFEDSDIQSCHSMGGSYFRCAVAEAQNEGAIAFAVKTEDLKGVNLDEREIFVDRDIGFKGILPIQRVRIRPLQDQSKKTIYGIPEQRTYPNQRVNGFQQEVQKFVIQAQKELFIKETPEGQKELDFTTSTRELGTLGGSYFDSSIGSMLAGVLEQIVKDENIKVSKDQEDFINALKNHSRIAYIGSESKFSGVVGDEDEEDEDEMAREAEEDEFRQGIRYIRDTYLINQCDFDWQWGEGYANIDYDVSFKVTLPKEMFTETFLNAREQNLDVQIRDAIEDSDVFNYPDTQLKEVFVVKSSVIQITVLYGDTLNVAHDFVSRMRDFATFCGRYPKEEVEAELIAIMNELGFIEEDTESVETDIKKLSTFNRWVRNNTSHFFYNSNPGDKHRYRLVPDKKHETVNDTNLSSTTWLLSKLEPSQISLVSTYAMTSVINSKLNSQADKYFRNLIETSPAGSENQQQFEFLPLSIDRSSKQQYRGDLFQGIEFSVLVFGDYPKEGVLTYGYDKSDKRTWIYAQFEIVVDAKKIENLNNLFKLIEGLEKDPQIAVDAMAQIMREHFSDVINARQGYDDQKTIKGIRGFETRGEAAAKQAEQPAEQKTELTEAKKKIIRENLLKLLRRNKGRK